MTFVHVAALGTTERQIDFVRAARARAAPRISAGTYGRAVYGENEAVQKLLALADLFFMNENEASGLFGTVDAVHAEPGKLIFVTLGARGALVIQGDHVMHVPGMAAAELDPTGAGDTFCGATLAGLARGEHPVMAARAGQRAGRADDRRSRAGRAVAGRYRCRSRRATIAWFSTSARSNRWRM